MDNIRKTYKLLVLIIILVTGIAISAIYMVTIQRIENIHQESTAATMVQAKKDFLKDNVDNLILAMDTRRENIREYYEAYLVRVQRNLDEYQRLSPSEFLSLSRDYFEDNARKSAFAVIMIHLPEEQVVYGNKMPKDFPALSKDEQQKYLDSQLVGYFEKEYGSYRVLVGIPHITIDDTVKEEIYHQIHNFQYSQDAYFWVNQVLNYEGGEN